MNIPVFDLHCDTALELLGRPDRPERSLRKNDCHIDLDRAGKMAGYYPKDYVGGKNEQ